MQIRIEAAQPHHQSVLENLLELYCHDCSPYFGLKIGPDGRYGYPQLPLYWQEAGRFPFLVYSDEQLAGFVFVRQGSRLSQEAPADQVWDMAEFFIVRGSRRQGAGAEIARQVWKHFPGRWEIRVLERNQPALAFWAHAISEFVGAPVTPSPFEVKGMPWQVFRFASGAAQ